MTEGTGLPGRGAVDESAGSAQAPTPERVVYVQPPPVQKRSMLRRILRLLVLLLFVFMAFMIIGLSMQVALLSGGRGELRERYISGDARTPKKVAIVNVTGLIADTAGGRLTPAGNFKHVMQQLKKAREDDKVVSVLLEVNSPGGSVTASDIILHEVERTKKAGKKVIVWMGDLAASGGYYVSCKADEIYACNTTLTGSIGVIMNLVNLEGLSEKIGVKPVVFKCGELKDMGSPYREMTDAEKEKFQALGDSMFARFKRVIQEGRGLSDEEVGRVANGAVMTAQDALAGGLIDKIGYLEEAVDAAKGKDKEAAVVRYERPTGLFALSGHFAEAKPLSAEVHVHVGPAMPGLTPGLYYLWLPGAAVRR